MSAVSESSRHPIRFQFDSVLTNLGYCFCNDGVSLYLTDILRSGRAEFDKNIVISSQRRANVLKNNQIS